ncbi:MAG: sensor histidine kinase [Chromatiaceae bacterium]|nr:sensor histidine kinase [Chromatiaceae bacterium]MCF7993967.1 sensor histidine kinase [Chromatiaceae bacterium]MCF8015663.1 sensor histidine kinase [Chromatiaceae bacterium]
MLLLLLALSPSPGAQPVPLLDSDQVATRWIHPTFQLYVDPSGGMTLAEIRSLKDSAFQPLDSRPIRNTSFQAAYWYRWSFTGKPGAPDQWLVIGASYLNVIDVYQPDADDPSGYRHLRMGDHVAHRDWPIRNTRATVAVTPQSSEQPWYLRVQTNGPLTFFARLVLPSRYLSESLRWALWHALIFGALLLSASLFIGAGVYLHRPLFQYYGLHNASLLILLLVKEGYLALLLPGMSGSSADILLRGSLLLANMLGILSFSLLGEDRQWPLLHRFGRGIILLALLLLPLVTSEHFMPGRDLLFVLSPLYFIGLLALQLSRMARRQQPYVNLLFALALLVIVIGQGSLHLVALGLIAPSFFLLHFFEVSLFVHIFGLSAMMVYLHHGRERESEQLRLQTRLLEQRQLAQNRLLRMLTHEFRSPLTNIDKLAEFSEITQDSANPATRTRLLSQIRQQCRKGHKLIERFLVQEMEHKPPVRMRRTSRNLEQVLLEAIGSESLRSTLSPFRIASTGSAPVVIDLDEELLRTAIINLLENSVKYRLHASEITIELAFVDDSLVLSISNDTDLKDSGELQQLIQPQVRGSNATHQQGSGLGLALVNDIAQAHGGRVQLDLSPPRLRVQLRLPRHYANID